jgi:hypothetical protein
LKTYKSGTGHLQTVANTIDRGTQIIRSGRFLTPAYAQWAVQNGLLHVSQAGAFVFRNAHQLKSEFPKASAETKAAIDGGTGKGIARASVGGASAQGMKISQKMTKIQEFWHKFDDQWARRMSAIHELNSHGYHDAAAWDKLRTTNPQRFRQIVAGHASREAINYSEMTPAERATFQKLFTAYGWTRGASTYAGRFYLQHPAQAAVGTQLANQEGKQADEWWRKLGGVAPSYLKESLPVMGGMLGTQWLSPTGTLGGLIEATPGATGGSTQNLSGELAPVPAALEEGLRGQTEYGQQLRGNEQVTKPITDLIGRFRPAGALQTIGGQKMGGTFKQGPEMGALKLAGVPYQQMKDPKQTAALGLKDYESSLSIPDKIRFQLDWKQRNLPDEMALYKHATGEDAPGKMISALKSDWDAVEQRDLFQHHFAQAAHSKTWKGLTPTARLQGTIQWMQDHGHNHSQLQQAQQLAKTSFVDDAEIDQVVNALWKGTGIGQVEAAWKTIVKGLQPHVVSK